MCLAAADTVRRFAGKLTLDYMLKNKPFRVLLAGRSPVPKPVISSGKSVAGSGTMSLVPCFALFRRETRLLLGEVIRARSPTL